MKKSTIFLISIVGLFISAVLLPKDFLSPKEVLFSIEKGEGTKVIAQNLENEGLIWWSQLFRAYVLVRGTSGKMQAGIYKLSSSMGTLIIAEKIARGDIATQTLTIPEGFGATQIAEKLRGLQGTGLISVDELKKYEGYLFPDTYKIPYKDWQTTDVIKMMRDNFEQKTLPYQEAIAQSGHTPAEIVIMASLIEKEVQTNEDKAIVSGIFWKRLANSLKLESCATIAYIKGVNQWRYSIEDTRIESPYNTYLNFGLPPGPIGNPGIESIKAAIYPKESPYWYWLSTTEGETIFSKTFEEHNLAKAKYLD